MELNIDIKRNSQNFIIKSGETTSRTATSVK